MDEDLAARLARFAAEHSAEEGESVETAYCPGVDAEKAARKRAEEEAAEAERIAALAKRIAAQPKPAPDLPPLEPKRPPIVAPAAPEQSGPELTPAWGEKKKQEGEKKISLGDVAKGRKDYEREPKNWK